MSLDFVALDVETANGRRGSICSIGLAVVEAGAIVRREHWLTRPSAAMPGWWFTGLHGIDAAAVRDQPEFDVRVTQLMDVIGDRPVIAHNAAFDIGALREACTEYRLDWPVLTYGCSLVMARRALRLISYRLPLVCAELGVPLAHHHTADDDAAATAEIVLTLARRCDAGSLEDLAAGLHIRLGRLLAREWRGCVQPSGCGGPGAPPDANVDADPDHPLYGQTVVFTGRLSSTGRREAWACAARFGAQVEPGVNKRTTLLVIGDDFMGQTVEEFHTGKALHAAKLCAKGQHIEVLTELDWLQLIADDATSGGWFRI